MALVRMTLRLDVPKEAHLKRRGVGAQVGSVFEVLSEPFWTGLWKVWAGASLAKYRQSILFEESSVNIKGKNTKLWNDLPTGYANVPK